MQVALYVYSHTHVDIDVYTSDVYNNIIISGVELKDNCSLHCTSESMCTHVCMPANCMVVMVTPFSWSELDV